MKLYAHPFSSYCQKAIVAFYETDTPFELRHLEAPGVAEEMAALWPLKRFPVLKDGDTTVVEATAIIEYLAATRPAAAWLVPADPVAAVEVRMMDRIFDNYVNGPQQAFIYDALRPEDQRHPASVTEAAAMFDRIYAWLDERMRGGEWATDHGFTLADCGAGPALFYADWTYPIPERFEALRAYRVRLLARPAMARAVDEARQYRSYFPLGAPERD